MKIRYGIYKKRDNGKGFEHKNHVMEITDNSDKESAHKKIMSEIYKKHPGWHIHGYSQDETGKETEK
jgi:hypothetical protein